MGDSIEYPDVVQEIRGAMNPGRLKLQSNSIIFKNIKTGKVDTFNAGDVVRANWLIRSRGHCLKITLKGGSIHRFDGLRETEYDKLSAFLKKYYSTSLEKKEASFKGWNWGSALFNGNALNFTVEGKTAFEVPLGNVSHTLTGKNEVTLEFHQNDDAAVSLMEMRFHIPTDTKDPEKDSVQDFYQNVLDKADIIQITGDAMANFQEVQCLTPRGRYDIKIYPSFLQLHGKTFDYKIPYTTILRFFLLPHRDGRQMFFVVSLDPPMKQGQTRYPFLILLFNKEDETSLELPLSEEELQEKYDGKLQKEMSGPEYEVVSRIMKTLVNRKITIPGNFTGHSGTHSIACSYKAATGFLYPLERGLVFIHKPPMHIRFDEVSCVNFARSAGSTRTFDFDVETKANSVYTFVGIEKEEYGKLYDFVSQKKLRVKNIGGKMQKGGGGYKEDMMDSDEDGEHDAYLERMKEEGKQKDDDDDDDSDESDDEDFAPVESASDVAEEWDSEVSTSSSSDEDMSGDEEAKKEKKEKKRLEKEKKRAQKEKRAKKDSEGPKRKRKPKKEKDPDRPKRAATAYMLWLNDIREEIKEENPGISVIDLTKKAGEMWRSIDKDKKSKYEKLAAVEKEKYQEAMAEYNAKPKNTSPQASEDDEDDDEGEEGEEKSGKKKKAKKSDDDSSRGKKSPKKGAIDTRAGSGANYKSKEYISSSSESTSTSDEDKPLKRPKKEGREKKKKKKGAEKEKPSKKKDEDGDDSMKDEDEDDGSKKDEEEDDSKKKDDEEDEFAGLPDDEEILSTPEGSGSESGGGSGSESEASGGDDDEDDDK